MAHWNYREELSQAEKLKRSYYELLRDELDQFLIQYTLIDSYHNFISRQTPFPFVEKREMKPRGRIPDKDSVRLTIPVELDFQALGRSLYQMILGGQSFRYTFKAKVEVGTSLRSLQKASLPFELAGQLRVQR